MTDTLRITVKAPDAETAEKVKEAFFKKLYEHSGTTVIFELPVGAEEEAAKIKAFAEEAGCTAATERHADPLDEATPVDFW